MIKKILSKVDEFYGNRGTLFDIILAGIIIGIILIFKIDIGFVEEITSNMSEALISFFGILVGFLLTTFSLLFLYNPENSEAMKKVRTHSVYKSMLNAFISTSFFTIILTLTIICSSFFQISSFVFFLALFVLFRIMKCLYFLHVIITLS